MYLQKSLKSLFILLIPCFSLLCVSCQSGPEAPEGACTVTFSISNYRQISFDDLSSSGMSRAVPTDHPATLAHLLVAVFGVETGVQALTPIQRNYEDYELDPEAYRQFSMTLPYGRYRVLVLGYNGSKACNITSLNHITWADDYVPNTFLYCEELTLDEGSTLNKEITLKHVVAALRVTAEDAIPAEMKKMRFVSTAGGTVLDAMTGFAPQSTGRTSEIVVPASYIGTVGLDFTAYLFLPQEQTTGCYTVQALGANDAVLYEKHFNDVPLRINYLTQWQGNFFDVSSEDVPAVQNGFNVKWDTEWAGTLTVN